MWPGEKRVPTGHQDHRNNTSKTQLEMRDKYIISYISKYILEVTRRGISLW
jgi:hypothetical protein